MKKKTKIILLSLLAAIIMIVSITILLPIIYSSLDEGYQTAMDPTRMEHAEYIASLIFEYDRKTGTIPFAKLSTEKQKPILILIGRSDQEEVNFAKVEALSKDALYMLSSHLEKELSDVLGKNIILPRDPQTVPTYAPNVYVYFVTPEQFSVAVHLYKPSDKSVEYSWPGGTFYSHTLTYSRKN